MDAATTIEDRMRAVAQSVAAGFGATAEVTWREIAAPTINTPEEATAMADAAAGAGPRAADGRNGSHECAGKEEGGQIRGGNLASTEEGGAN